jgi:uncharacterized membrane protein
MENPTQQQIDLNDLRAKPVISRWAALAGAVILGLLFAALPERITFGFGWVPLAIIIIITLVMTLPHLVRRPFSPSTIRLLSLVVLGVVTLALAISVSLMIYTLPNRNQSQAGTLLQTAGLLWLANIFVFALWYWEVDGGGPIKRHKHKHQAADFMFPQQVDGNTKGWVPHFFDYLFVAFTAATALSPTDTYPLTRRAKMLMMMESIIAMLTVLVLVGRAVNIL